MDEEKTKRGITNQPKGSNGLPKRGDGRTPKHFSFSSFKGKVPSNDEAAAEEKIQTSEPFVSDAPSSLNTQETTPETTADNDRTPAASDSEPWEKQVEQMDNVDAPEVGAAIENLNATSEQKDEWKVPKRQGLPRRNPESAPKPAPEQAIEKQDDATMNETTKKKTEAKKSTRKGRKAHLSQTVKAKKSRKGSGGKTPAGLPSKKKKKKGMRTWMKVLIVLLILALAGIAAVVGLYQYNRQDISDYKYSQKQKTQIISADNQTIGSLFSENRTYVSLNQIPDNMKNALISIEDSRFYDHGGVDYFGIARSLVSNLVSRDATSQGASTITQQLARLLFLPDISTEQTLGDSINRKFKEISIAWQLEDKYSKNQILEMYLNEYYFGSSAYGIEEAAKTYFGKDIWNCNLSECAMLAGLPQAPSAYAPNAHYSAAKHRQEQVLDRMAKLGYITEKEAKAAKAERVNVAKFDSNSLNNQVTEGYEKFVNRALQQYAESQAASVMKAQGISRSEAIKYTRKKVASGGYKIYTTINTGMQQQARLVSLSRYPSGSSVTNAIVTMDLDGSVRAYYGGNTQIDMANTARQPGSNIKPLYYSGAIDKGLFTAGSTLPNHFSLGNWTPKSHGKSASVSLTTALVESLNAPSAYVMYRMGVKTSIEWMKTMGISTFTDNDYNVATSLGGMSRGIKPIEMAAAFNVFNNSGVYNQPKFITKVENSNGSTIFKASDLNLDSHQVMKQSTATTMKSILRQVVTRGTGTAANVYSTAGKTGTTDAGKDLWFTGITGNLTTSIWVGNLNNVALGGYGSLSAGIYGTYMSRLGANGLITGLN
jgi:penicillin-binding protein 1A